MVKKPTGKQPIAGIRFETHAACGTYGHIIHTVSGLPFVDYLPIRGIRHFLAKAEEAMKGVDWTQSADVLTAGDSRTKLLAIRDDLREHFGS